MERAAGDESPAAICLVTDSEFPITVPPAFYN